VLHRSVPRSGLPRWAGSPIALRRR